MRYERKYRIESSSFQRVYHEVMSNPSGFRKVYPDRIVNSIYYDDVDYSAYNDNLLGTGERVKYRVRWYGETLSDVQNPILEKKIKMGLLGTKEHKPLADFSLQDGAPALDASILPKTNCLFPHVIVRYQRCYLESLDGLLRVTIDKDLRYINLINSKISSQSHMDSGLILELKYDASHVEIARQCSSMIPYRLTKNSKYVSAMRYYLQ